MTTTCFTGNTDIVELLLNANSDDSSIILTSPLDLNVQTKSCGFTPMISACEYGHAEIVGRLLNASSDDSPLDVNIQLNSGYTALMVACLHRRTDMVELLVNASYDDSSITLASPLDLNIKTRESEMTALMWTCIQGDIDIVKLLLNASSNNSSIKLASLLDINIRDKRGRTALHWVCIKGHTNIVELLLNACSDGSSVSFASPLNINIKGTDGESVLFTLFRDVRNPKEEYLYLELTERMITQFNADINNLTSKCDGNFNVIDPLINDEFIKHNDFTSIVKYLLVAGVSQSPSYSITNQSNSSKLCEQWFSLFGKDNTGVVSLKLMILRNLIYCTTTTSNEKINIPREYPKLLYQWPSYDQEIDKIKRSIS